MNGTSQVITSSQSFHIVILWVISNANSNSEREREMINTRNWKWNIKDFFERNQSCSQDFASPHNIAKQRCGQGAEGFGTKVSSMESRTKTPKNIASNKRGKLVLCKHLSTLRMMFLRYMASCKCLWSGLTLDTTKNYQNGVLERTFWS